MSKITIDGKEYATEDMNENARKILASIQFVEEEIHRRKNQLAIADTARIGYTNALKRELNL